METNKICPIKELTSCISFSILGISNANIDAMLKLNAEKITKSTYCNNELCAWWNTTRGCCGIMANILNNINDKT